VPYCHNRYECEHSEHDHPGERRGGDGGLSAEWRGGGRAGAARAGCMWVAERAKSQKPKAPKKVLLAIDTPIRR
jgi:hypothetical protein